jgi:hypothetical protein
MGMATDRNGKHKINIILNWLEKLEERIPMK